MRLREEASIGRVDRGRWQSARGAGRLRRAPRSCRIVAGPPARFHARGRTRGRIHVAVRSDRQGRHRHRLVARHRPRDRRAARRAWRERGRSPRARPRPARRSSPRSTRATAHGRAVAIPANISSKDDLRHLVDETTRALRARSTSSSATPRPTPITGRWRHLRRPVPQNPRQQHARQPLADPASSRRGMIERADGSIIIVSSIGGLKGSPMIGAYNVSKAADFQLARNLAVEFGPHNVRVNCIAPGLVRTDFARALWENPATLKAVDRDDAARADRRARRDRRRRGLPRLAGERLHDRPDDRRRRRGDDRVSPRARPRPPGCFCPALCLA